jgi:hypothetical protein
MIDAHLENASRRDSTHCTTLRGLLSECMPLVVAAFSVDAIMPKLIVSSMLNLSFPPPRG